MVSSSARFLLSGLVAFAACGTSSRELGPTPDADPDGGGEEPKESCHSDQDLDGDRLDDGEEACLARAHAPVLQLPLGIDWTLPSSAEWYLERADLRFAYDGGCVDQQVLDAPLDADTVIEQWLHTRTSAITGCRKEDQIVHAANGPFHLFERFYLKPVNEDVRAGVPTSQATTHWTVYTHVYPNSIGGVNIQYWYYFPYNDNLAGFSHEGDWEHVTLRLREGGTIDGAWFAAHVGGAFHEENELTFFDDARAHPLIWIAEGSHASYVSEQVCDDKLVEGVSENCETAEAYRWFTDPGTRPAGHAGISGAGLVDLGERGATTLSWARYCGAWGSIGQISPPPEGPVCKDDRRWLVDAATWLVP